MPKRLVPPKWPHFMEKKFKPKEAQYHSEKILGQLYDKVETVNFAPQYTEPFDRRILRKYTLDDGLLKTVRQVKTQYDTAMRRLMAQQEINTEFEIWSTFVLSRPRVGSDYKLQEEIGRLSEALKEQFRAVCREKAGGKTFDILGPFVAGMYKVTKEEMDIALAECRSTRVVGGREVTKRKMEPRFMPLISFPWLFEKELGRIATGIDLSDDFDAGLTTLTLNDGKSRKRQGGGAGVFDMEDFIQQEDGVIVHRGEELELFRHDDDLDDLAIESDDEPQHLQDGHDLSTSTNSDSVIVSEFRLDNSIPAHELSGTGVEEVVPTTQMDGFITPRDVSQIEASCLDSSYYNDWQRTKYSSSTESPVIVDSQSSSLSGSSFEQVLPKGSDTINQLGQDTEEVEEKFVYLNLKKESNLEEPARLVDCHSSKPNPESCDHPRHDPQTGEPASALEGKDTNFLKDQVDERKVDEDTATGAEVPGLGLKAFSMEQLARMVDPDTVSVGEDAQTANGETQVEEEVIELDLQESSLEKLARMMDS
jgi:RNA-dependent RNA polymerase